MAANAPLPAAAGTFRLGDMTVHRMGFGAMRITGQGIWGEPKDLETCKRVLRRAVELGINLIDTADSYGPDVSERIIGETLHPYANGLVIATNTWACPTSTWISSGRLGRSSPSSRCRTATTSRTAPASPCSRSARRRASASCRGTHSPPVSSPRVTARSPVMLPIPGTSSVQHLEENTAAAAVKLTPDEVRELAR